MNETNKRAENIFWSIVLIVASAILIMVGINILQGLTGQCFGLLILIFGVILGIGGIGGVFGMFDEYHPPHDDNSNGHTSDGAGSGFR